MVQKILSNTLLDTMMTMLSYHYPKKLPQMIGYVRNFDGNRTMSFKISDSKLLKKYNQVWKRVEKY